MNGDSVAEGVACFADILLVTPAALNYENEIFTSHDMEYFALNVFPHWKVHLFSVINVHRVRNLTYYIFLYLGTREYHKILL